MTCVNEIIFVSVLCQRRLANNASGQKAENNKCFSSGLLCPPLTAHCPLVLRSGAAHSLLLQSLLNRRPIYV